MKVFKIIFVFFILFQFVFGASPTKLELKKNQDAEALALKNGQIAKLITNIKNIN